MKRALTGFRRAPPGCLVSLEDSRQDKAEASFQGSELQDEF